MDSRKKSVRNKQSVNVSASLSLNESKETLSSSVATTDTTPCSLTPDECLSTSSPDLVKIPALDKYSLRPKSIKNRIEVELKRKAPVVKKTPKPKAKPVPLSKYRRRTANARERTRMQEINDAFEELRSAIPDILAASAVSSSSGDETHSGVNFRENYHPSSSSSSSSSSSRSQGNHNQSNKNHLSKITTLRLAVNYIACLADLLKQTDPVDGNSRELSSTDASPAPSLSSSVSSQFSEGNNPNRLSNEGIKLSNTSGDDNISNMFGNRIDPPSPLGLSSLDLELDVDLNVMTADFDSSSFLSFYANHGGNNHQNSHHQHSCSSSLIDLPSSYHSPANSTETDSSIESYTSTSSGWESVRNNQQQDQHSFHHQGLEDVCVDTFDLILESEDSEAMS